MIGAALEGRVELRPPRPQELRHAVFGEGEVEAKPSLARSCPEPIAFGDDLIALMPTRLAVTRSTTNSRARL